MAASKLANALRHLREGGERQGRAPQHPLPILPAANPCPGPLPRREPAAVAAGRARNSRFCLVRRPQPLGGGNGPPGEAEPRRGRCPHRPSSPQPNLCFQCQENALKLCNGRQAPGTGTRSRASLRTGQGHVNRFGERASWHGVGCWLWDRPHGYWPAQAGSAQGSPPPPPCLAGLEGRGKKLRRGSRKPEGWEPARGAPALPK